MLMVAVFAPGLGVSVNGSARWIGVGWLAVEPSELAKLAVVVYAARLLSERSHRIGDPRSYRPVLLLAVGMGGLMLAQPDMATAIIVVAIIFVDLALVGVSRASLGRIALTAMVAAAAVAVVAPDERSRLTSFLHPTVDPLGKNYQTMQGLIAVSSGGLFGKGLGGGIAQWGYLPAAYTDSIYAIIAQQTGLVGALFVVALFALVAYLGVVVTLRAADTFGALLAGGVTAWITVQAILNIGAVVAVLPVTGVALPFVSYGGTSLIVLLFAVGILINVAKTAHQPGASAGPARARAGRAG